MNIRNALGMKYLYILFSLVSIVANGQSNIEQFKQLTLNNEYVDEKDIKANLIKYDFSPIFTMTSSQSIMGFIGAEYQRFQIKFVSVIKDARNPDRYLVYGKSMVKGNVCQFQGTMVIESARRVKNLEYPDVTSGLIFGKYVFYEDASQKHVGIFEGNFSSNWYIDKNGAVQYDDLMDGADGFSNNLFVGNWIAYGGTKPRPCHWGDYRIPLSGDLDNGAGEFYPDEKYVQNGWQNFIQAYGGRGHSTEAAERERAEWWK